MLPEPAPDPSSGNRAKRSGPLPWLSGLIVGTVWGAVVWLLYPTRPVIAWAGAAACFIAALPGFLIMRRHQRQLALEAGRAAEEAARLRLQLETVRHRTAQLREELSAADRQARRSHQLTLLGQFAAGFMHEFNNPLSVVMNRIEILLDERQDDEALCADLRQMLKDARYMGSIAGTLLQALRRERGSEVYDPAAPAETMAEVCEAMGRLAEQQGVQLVREIADVPRVDLPAHVVSEVLRGLVANALQALQGREGGVVRLRLEPYRTAGAKVVLRVEDNGPGVPESIRQHLFEPFVSRSAGRERLGLGLFLAASLMDMYGGRLRHEERETGGACFVIEMAPARFARGRPYHWFVGGEST